MFEVVCLVVRGKQVVSKSKSVWCQLWPKLGSIQEGLVGCYPKVNTYTFESYFCVEYDGLVIEFVIFVNNLLLGYQCSNFSWILMLNLERV